MSVTSPPQRLRNRVAAFTLAAAVLGAGGVFSTPAMAQSNPSQPAVQPLRFKRPVRRAVIDLAKTAKEVRPGQVVPVEQEPEDAVITELPPTTPPPAPTAVPATPPPASGAATGWGTPTSLSTAPASSAPAVNGHVGTPPPAAPAPAAPTPAADPVRPVVAAPVVAGSATDAAAAPNGTPVRLVVLAAYAPDGEGPQAQWRPLGADETAWKSIETGGRAEERIEIRTGLGGSSRIEVDGVAVVQVDRLSRVRIERRNRPDASEISIELVRGRIEVQFIKLDETGLGAEPVRIRTPDAVLVRRIPVSVTFDAFKGTRETAASASR